MSTSISVSLVYGVKVKLSDLRVECEEYESCTVAPLGPQHYGGIKEALVFVNDSERRLVGSGFAHGCAAENFDCNNLPNTREFALTLSEFLAEVVKGDVEVQAVPRWHIQLWIG